MMYDMNLQLDGRPMSGDIGRGATRESIAFTVRLAASKERPPGKYELLRFNLHIVIELWECWIFYPALLTLTHLYRLSSVSRWN